MLPISNADIVRAERVLLPPGCTFNEERRAFIKCMESRDVVACPGSGKTTALLAKLLILAAQQPFRENRGICVLTHTNVAIDEIKRRAGGAADALFVHPNYFGTIQGFVNRFLAIPAYRNRYKRPVQAIDNGQFFAAIKSRYELDIGLQRWLEPRGGIGTLGGYWFKPDDLSIGSTMDDDINGLSRRTPTYRKIEGIRKILLEQGVLSYNDAYSLGLNYISRFPNVVDAIRHRFRLVFIDEMQDTDDHQLRVLDKLFDACDSVILQRLGDPNQAIYQSEVKQETLWSPTNPALPFSDSLRYGATIAKVLDTVRVDRTLTLAPNPHQQSLPPHILLFQPGAEDTVLPAFGAIIREYGLHELEAPKFSAIGWVGKDKTDQGKVCLRCYHQSYQKSLKSNSRWFGTLLSYAQRIDVSLKDSPQNAAAVSDIVLAGIIRALWMAGLSHPKTRRPFTVATLQSHLKQSNDMRLFALRVALAEWGLSLRQGKMSAEQLRDAVSTFLRKNFITDESKELAEFLNSDAVDFSPPQTDRSNTYVTPSGDVIDIGTVHSVKGETHTATIYLETFYHALDSKRLLPFCLGKYLVKESQKFLHRQNLKIAHVAFSRPTHLLAFACCKEHVEGQEAAFESAGWVVREIG